MTYYLFKILDPKTAKNELLSKGLKDLYELKDAETKEHFIGGRSAKKPTRLKASKLVEERPETIDWEEQWSLFAENFSEGKAEIDLSRFGGKKILSLLPGPGFGDLSHPTTALMLEMMEGRVENESILDIGTGSGILALAALLLNASSAIGIDIEKDALIHARKNAKLNHLCARFVQKLPSKIPSSNICLLNMILPEQKTVLRQRKTYDRKSKLWITSGILKEQRKEYLALTKSWGWHLEKEYKKDGWLGFIFVPKFS